LVRKKEAAVVVGKAHTKVALDFCYLAFACGHLNDLGRLRRLDLPSRIRRRPSP
jgi:hypothetical protein